MLQILAQKMIALTILSGFSATGNLGLPVGECVTSTIRLARSDGGMAGLLLDLGHRAIGRVVHLRVGLLSGRLELTD
jgi:hypothetical protein